MSLIKAQIQTFLGLFGYRLTRSFLPQLLRNHRVDLVLDVGANAGDFGLRLRHFGFRGKIVSFEPAAVVWDKLRQRALADGNWIANNYALGSQASTMDMISTQNPMSSSLRDLLPAHLEAAPDSQQVGTETVEIRRLDDTIEEFQRPGDVTFLKIDTQGFEREVLEGSSGCIDSIAGLQIEVSMVPLYTKQDVIEEMFRYLRDRGFVPVDIEPMFRNRATCQLLQCDAIFFRPPTVAKNPAHSAG